MQNFTLSEPEVPRVRDLFPSLAEGGEALVAEQDKDKRLAWVQSMPFFIVHLLPFAAFWTGVRWTDVALCFALYYARMFFITGGYHRYFSHRSYKTSRFMQFLIAFGGGTSMQKGALWWGANHRHHHKYSDKAEDAHSPNEGFWWSHVGWILCKKYGRTQTELIGDLNKYPELRFLNKFHLIPPALLGLAVFLVGGWSALWIGFFLSTVLLWHGTFLVNSLAHVWGTTPYDTGDLSRNNLLIAILTLGEGWHNNHHHYQVSARQGFRWYQIDGSFYVLRVMEFFGLVWDLKLPPQRIIDEAK